jgi:hypothetical protein
VCQVVCEAEGFDVFLYARRHGPLVPPELVPLQIRLHGREDLLDLYELRVRDLGNLLAILGPLGRDAVEEEDQLLREVCRVSAGLSGETEGSDDGSGFGRVGAVCVDLDQFLSRVLVVVELRPEVVEHRYYLFLRAQTVASSVHDCVWGWR